MVAVILDRVLELGGGRMAVNAVGAQRGLGFGLHHGSADVFGADFREARASRGTQRDAKHDRDNCEFHPFLPEDWKSVDRTPCLAERDCYLAVYQDIYSTRSTLVTGPALS
ncbi:MAG: hypothetical protein ACTS6J_04945 [Burkholderiales bacterium]